MNENEIFKLADLILGTNYNRGRTVQFANAVFGRGVSAGSNALFSSVFKGTVDEELRTALKTCADPKCLGCDGTGLFYGNVAVCPCTYKSVDLDELETRFVHAAMIASNNVSTLSHEDLHCELIDRTQNILNRFRAQVPDLPGVRYWYHPESECLLTTYGQAEIDRISSTGEGLVELDRVQFLKQLSDNPEKRVSEISDNGSNSIEDDDEL